MSKMQNVKELYEEADNVWPSNDKWHCYVHAKTTRLVEKWSQPIDSFLILNAGSGGTTYNISGEMYHVDICEKNIKKFDNYYVGDIDNLPYDDHFFDLIICVGSVLNYCTDLNKVFKEFCRVLKDNGHVILEYEKSNSAEFKKTNYYELTSFKTQFEYNKQKHELIIYSSKYVNDQMSKNGFSLKKRYWLHVLSSINLGKKPNYQKATKWAFFDNIAQFLGCSNSANVIELYEKN